MSDTPMTRERGDFKFKVDTRKINAAQARLERALGLAERGLLYRNVADIAKAITQTEHALDRLWDAYWAAKPLEDR